MLRVLAILVIGAAFGGGIGFVLGARNTPTEHASDGQSSDHSAHDHSQVLHLPSGVDAPSLDISVIPDPESGWNLNLQTSNFTFAAENAGKAHIEGQGHGHLYVNGVKRARVYGDWFHIGSLPVGDNQISVTLNSNDHKSIVVGDAPLSASVNVTVVP